MEWSDLALIARDVFENAAMWIGAAACAIFAGVAAALVASPAHRQRYEPAADEAGDTHVNWALDTLTRHVPRPDSWPAPPLRPNRRVRAGTTGRYGV